MKELKEALPEIPENSLKRYLHEHEKYLNFKKDHNRYRIPVSEIEKLKLIRQHYSVGLKKEEVNAKLEESGIPVTVKKLNNESSVLISVHNELADVKKLVSFLVQQNEQTRLQLNKMKDQNSQLIFEVNELSYSIEEMKGLLQKEYKKEAQKVAYLRENLIATQKSVEEVVSSVEAEKSGGLLKRVFRKWI